MLSFPPRDRVEAFLKLPVFYDIKNVVPLPTPSGAHDKSCRFENEPSTPTRRAKILFPSGDSFRSRSLDKTWQICCLVRHMRDPHDLYFMGFGGGGFSRKFDNMRLRVMTACVKFMCPLSSRFSRSPFIR